MKPGQVYDRIRKIIEWTPRSSRLLDIGCDRGDVTARFRSKAREVYGADNNPQAIAEAKRLHKGVHFTLAAGERLPFKDNFFDTVVMGDVLEHVSDERAALAEAHRVLKPNGTLVLSVPHKGLFGFIDSFNLKFRFPRLYRIWKGKNYNPKVYDIQPWHRHYNLNDLKRLFGRKFAITRVHRGGLIVYPICWVLSDLLSDLNIALPALLGLVNRARHLEYQADFKAFGYAIIVTARCRKGSAD